MTIDEHQKRVEQAKADVAKADAELRALKGEVKRLGQEHGSIVFFTLFEGLLKVVFQMQGNLSNMYERRFYEAVLARLNSLGFK